MWAVSIGLLAAFAALGFAAIRHTSRGRVVAMCLVGLALGVTYNWAREQGSAGAAYDSVMLIIIGVVSLVIVAVSWWTRRKRG